MAPRGGKGRIARPPGLNIVGAQGASRVVSLPWLVIVWMTITCDTRSSSCSSIWRCRPVPGSSPSIAAQKIDPLVRRNHSARRAGPHQKERRALPFHSKDGRRFSSRGIPSFRRESHEFFREFLDFLPSGGDFMHVLFIAQESRLWYPDGFVSGAMRLRIACL